MLLGEQPPKSTSKFDHCKLWGKKSELETPGNPLEPLPLGRQKHQFPSGARYQRSRWPMTFRYDAPPMELFTYHGGPLRVSLGHVVAG